MKRKITISRIENINSKKEKLKKSEKQLLKEIHQEKLKSNRNQRKERTRNLILAGTIFEKVGLLEKTLFDREILIGFLLSYKKLTEENREKLKKIGEEYSLLNKNQDRLVNPDEIKNLLKMIKENDKIFLEIQKKYRKNDVGKLTLSEYKELTK